jgi:hypothetical protein
VNDEIQPPVSNKVESTSQIKKMALLKGRLGGLILAMLRPAVINVISIFG